LALNSNQSRGRKMARTTEGTNTASQVFLWLAIIGALNWGLVGFFNWYLVRAVFGHDAATDASGLARIVYALVGLAGLGLAVLAPRLRVLRTSHDVMGRRAEIHP
jgi:uncharacterized membrane protein YuzA (DUF378 family)